MYTNIYIHAYIHTHIYTYLNETEKKGLLQGKNPFLASPFRLVKMGGPLPAEERAM